MLRKLEAYGFKSFADKTEIAFGEGITVVVGPNGSGKSNISDAIRWVLGEQSVRNLRGTKMEDVIFAGSSLRRALGVAEVSLIFDNTDGALPLDFNEVSITRRVFRSGESEYFINKTHCRLRDIHELLADTGLGRDSMTVIGQNKVDEILNSKAEERRLLFEEIAGIAKYKQRKKEALRKMQDTTQNLVRVSDITAELENQMGPLAESAARTARYNEIHAELLACQATLLIDKLVKAEKMVTSIELQRQSLADNEIATHTKLLLNETETERLTHQLAQADAQITTIELDITATNTEIEKMDSKVAVLEERIKQSKVTQERMDEQISNAHQEKSKIGDHLALLQKNLADKREQATHLEQVVAGEKQIYQENNAVIGQIELEIERAKEKNLEFLEEVMSEQNKLATTERDLSRLKMNQCNFDREYQEYTSQLAHSKAQYDSIIMERQELQQSLTTIASNKEEFMERRLELNQIVTQKKLQEVQLTKELNELRPRLTALTSMQQEYEGFGRGIKSVLKSSASWQQGICGAVAQILSVPNEYVTAIEIALGGALQHIITKDDQIAKQAIEFLKQQRLGRATFLPLNTIRVSRPRESELAAASSQGILGFAAQLVTTEACYRPVIDFLLGRTIVAENMDHALRVAKQHSFGIKLVTIEGELLNPGGSMTGGSTNRREASFLGRSNEIVEINQSITNREAMLASLHKVIEDLELELTRFDHQVKELQQQQQRLEVRHAELIVHTDQLQIETGRLTTVLHTMKSEMSESHNEQNQLESKLIDIKNKVLSCEERDSQHKWMIIQLQQQAKELHEKKEVLSQRLIDQQGAFATIQQEIAVIHTNVQRDQQEEGQLEGKRVELEVEQTTIAAQINQALAESKEWSVLKAQSVEEKMRQEHEHKKSYAVKMEILSTLQHMNKELKELRRTHSDTQQRLHELELMFTKYNYEVNHCNEELQTHFKLTREQAMNICCTGSKEEIARKSKKLEEEISVLGSVNFSAIEEYAALQERYQFLKAQYHDLMEAKDSLLAIISDIDKTMSKQFLCAFEKINEYFGEVFIKLFGGGKAELQLVDPEHMLETGIEIMVQPSGKKQQNLILLSGGERALTVIALLFAFLKYRPAPFALVDEIDAPLDEANIHRFSEFLREYAKDTQFIIVTHRKATMEIADVLHGITMEESGVSRLVSVKFMDKAG